MTGRVLGRQARVEVAIRLPHQPQLSIEFVVDTGFDGYLALPPAAITALGLPPLHDITANLADGSRVTLALYTATIIWDNVEQDVTVLALDRRPLLGTMLLDGYDLDIQFADGGLVTITKL